MKDSSSDATFDGEPSGFDSLGAELFISDEPGDTTVRPPSPLLRKLAEAEREKIARWGKQAGWPTPPAEGPENSSSGNDK